MYTAKSKLWRSRVLYWNNTETRLSMRRIINKAGKVLGIQLNKNWNKARHDHHKIKVAKVLGAPLEQSWNKAEHAQRKIQAAEVLGTPLEKTEIQLGTHTANLLWLKHSCWAPGSMHKVKPWGWQGLGHSIGENLIRECSPLGSGQNTKKQNTKLLGVPLE